MNTVVTADGLRCRAPRKKDPGRACNKLLVMWNAEGIIAGCFKCERCGILIEVSVTNKVTSQSRYITLEGVDGEAAGRTL
jgi:hypothetical protein